MKIIKSNKSKSQLDEEVVSPPSVLNKKISDITNRVLLDYEFNRLMRIKLRAYESNSVVLSCARLVSILQPTRIVKVRRRLRNLSLKKKSLSSQRSFIKKKLIKEKIFGLLSLRGPIPLPTKLRKYCLLASPHINKTARDQYEMRVHKRLLYVLLFDKYIINTLRTINILPGVNAEILYS